VLFENPFEVTLLHPFRNLFIHST